MTTLPQLLHASGARSGHQGTEGGVPPSITWRPSTALKDPALSCSSFDGTLLGGREQAHQTRGLKVPA